MSFNSTDASRNINKAYGDNTVNQRTVQHWFKRFKSADESLENKQREKPETIVDDEVIRNLIEEDTCQTSRELAKKLDVTHLTALRYLHCIGKWANGFHMN